MGAKLLISSGASGHRVWVRLKIKTAPQSGREQSIANPTSVPKIASRKGM
jgi:hypothetical protein